MRSRYLIYKHNNVSLKDADIIILFHFAASRSIAIDIFVKKGIYNDAIDELFHFFNHRIPNCPFVRAFRRRKEFKDFIYVGSEDLRHYLMSYNVEIIRKLMEVYKSHKVLLMIGEDTEND